MSDLSPRLGGQSEVNGREPRLKTYSRTVKAGEMGTKGVVMMVGECRARGFRWGTIAAQMTKRLEEQNTDD